MKKRKIQIIDILDHEQPVNLLESIKQENKLYKSVQFGNLNQPIKNQQTPEKTQNQSNICISISHQKSQENQNSIKNSIKNSMSTSKSRTRRTSLLQMNIGSKKLVQQMGAIKNAKKNKKFQPSEFVLEKTNVLEDIIKIQKIKNLQKNFVKKVIRNNCASQPAYYTKLQQDNSLLNKLHGITLHPVLQNIIQFLSIIQILGFLYVYSLSLVFSNFQNLPVLVYVQTFSVFFYLFQFILNIVTVKSASGKKITLIKQIFQYYLENNFWIDAITILTLLMDITLDNKIVVYLRLFMFLKLDICFEKIQKMQVFLIQNVHKQQYWELAKVLLANFIFAHIIALFLLQMANFNQQNWLTDKSISNQAWQIQYIWAFYWATTIMLTVGFGDLKATNCEQALCLIFIQTFSCIMMAYNINRVGSIISNIRLQNQNRSKKLKIFKKLTDHNEVSQELVFKINNYIQESSKLKKQFNFQEDQQFLNQLPQTLKTTYLRQSNKQILNKLIFFKGLLDRTLCSIAQNLQMSIAHPQQTIRSLDDQFNLIILKNGHIGYICHLNESVLDSRIADQIIIKNKQYPFLTSLDFITRNKPKYQIMSLQFSIMYIISYQNLIKILKQFQLDYELFCYLRDKIKNIPDQFEVYPCQLCKQKTKHFKFNCPKLHYIPTEQNVINKYIYQQKIGKNKRQKFMRKNPSFQLTGIEYFIVVKDGLKKTKKNKKIQPFIFTKKSIRTRLQTLQRSSKKNQKLNKETISAIFQLKTIQILNREQVKKQKQDQFNDQIWNVNLDVAKNFNGYFSKDNYCNLSSNFNTSKRLQAKNAYILNRSNITNQFDFTIEQNNTIEEQSRTYTQTTTVFNNNENTINSQEL